MRDIRIKAFIRRAIEALTNAGTHVTQEHIDILTYLATVDRSVSPEEVLHYMRRLHEADPPVQPMPSTPAITHVKTCCTNCGVVGDIELSAEIQTMVIAYVSKASSLIFDDKVLYIKGTCANCSGSLLS